MGLSGGIGSGKSTAARLLEERGAVVIDLDVVAREVIEPGRPGFDAVVTRFGQEVLGPDGRLDRPALARVVFGEPTARADLDAIMHPLVAEETRRRIAEAPADAVVVVDVPLLVEAAARGYDVVVIVEAPEDTRLHRLARRGLSAEDARRRMAAQASDAERRAVADVVLDNSGSRADLEAQVGALWSELQRRLEEKRG